MRCIPIVLAAAVTAAIAACDSTAATHIAGVATGTSTSAATALAISPSTAAMQVGAQQQLTTNAPLNLQSQVQWRSSQPTVAAVSPTGLVTAVGVGTTQITARFSFDTATVATAAIAVTAATGTGNP